MNGRLHRGSCDNGINTEKTDILISVGNFGFA